MTAHCTLSAWTTNSETVHAVSDALMGPYRFANVVQVPWSHNPLVTRDPGTGDYLIAHIGCGNSIHVDPPKNCTATTGHAAATSSTAGRATNAAAAATAANNNYGSTNASATGSTATTTATTTAPTNGDTRSIRPRARDPLGLGDGDGHVGVDGAVVRPNDLKPPCGCPKYGHNPVPTPCQTLQVMRSPNASGPFEDATVAWPLDSSTAWPGCLSNPTLLFPADAGAAGRGAGRARAGHGASASGGGKGAQAAAATPPPRMPVVLLGFNGNLAPPNNHGPTSKPGLLFSTSGYRGPYHFVNGTKPGER